MKWLGGSRREKPMSRWLRDKEMGMSYLVAEVKYKMMKFARPCEVQLEWPIRGMFLLRKSTWLSFDWTEVILTPCRGHIGGIRRKKEYAGK